MNQKKSFCRCHVIIHKLPAMEILSNSHFAAQHHSLTQASANHFSGDSKIFLLSVSRRMNKIRIRHSPDTTHKRWQCKHFLSGFQQISFRELLTVILDSSTYLYKKLKLNFKATQSNENRQLYLEMVGSKIYSQCIQL